MVTHIFYFWRFMRKKSGQSKFKIFFTKNLFNNLLKFSIQVFPKPLLRGLIVYAIFNMITSTCLLFGVILVCKILIKIKKIIVKKSNYSEN
jgi:hypothetical protein